MVSPNQQGLSYDKILIDPYIKKQNTKLRQVIQNVFDKSANIIVQARMPLETARESNQHETGQSGTKINKWFNLYLGKDVVPKEELKLWKSLNLSSTISPMIIEVYLDLRGLKNKQTVVLKDDSGNPWTVCKGGSKKQEVVLERWLVEFDPTGASGAQIDELPLIYKQAIVLLRCLYAYERLMPVYRLRGVLSKTGLTIGSRILDGKSPISSKGRIGLSKSIIPHQMLLTETHLIHKFFRQIQTSFGAFKISVAFRKHCNFSLVENEELISTHFIHIDNEGGSVENTQARGRGIAEDSIQIGRRNSEREDMIRPHLDMEDHDKYLGNSKEVITGLKDINDGASTSISPCSSGRHGSKEGSPAYKKPSTTTAPVPLQRPSIHPFKVGSISSSPPTNTNLTYGGSSLERKISITSNKSTSNASLAAMLRNPRSSTSSTNSNIPVASNNNNQYVSSFPRSFSSSHGSHIPQEPESIQGFLTSDSVSNTPRFSSSFGSRAGRRFSNSSMRQNSLVGNDQLLLATSAGLSSSGPPTSGFYVEDDISDFVRMIDSKGDLRLSGFSSNNDSKVFGQSSNSQLDALNRFQMLRSQHQHLSDSVNASLILQHNQATGSRPSSRKSSHSMYSRSPSLRADSYDNAHMPSINSRLRECMSEDLKKTPSTTNESYDCHDHTSNDSLPKATGSKALDADSARLPTNISAGDHEVSGLATTPSAYSNKRPIHYENVFEDESDEEYFMLRKPMQPRTSNVGRNLSRSRPLHDDEFDDELLFPMSDMNLTKN